MNTTRSDSDILSLIQINVPPEGSPTRVRIERTVAEHRRLYEPDEGESKERRVA